jgi:hypothetical protein
MKLHHGFETHRLQFVEGETESILVSFDLLRSCCVQQVWFPDMLLHYCGQAW